MSETVEVKKTIETLLDLILNLSKRVEALENTLAAKPNPNINNKMSGFKPHPFLSTPKEWNRSKKKPNVEYIEADRNPSLYNVICEEGKNGALFRYPFRYWVWETDEGKPMISRSLLKSAKQRNY